MALKGKAKTDYQREYMRRRRGSKRSNGDGSNRSNRVDATLFMFQPDTPRVGLIEIKGKVRQVELDADGNPIPEY